MLEETFPCRVFLGPDKILGAMSSSSVPIALTGLPRSIIVPVSPILVVYTAGNGQKITPFGATPNLQIGYPGALTAFFNASAGLDQSTDQAIIRPIPNVTLAALTAFLDLSLVVSLASAAATGGPILSSTLGSGGTGYAANDTFTLTDGGGDATGVVDTVAAITGVVLTYHLTAAGTGYKTSESPSATTTDSIAGVGLTINYTVLQGNGSLYLDFDYKIVRLPLLASTRPSWPVVY